MKEKLLLIPEFSESGGTLTYFKLLINLLNQKDTLQSHILLEKSQLTEEIKELLTLNNLPFSIYKIPNYDLNKFLGRRINFYINGVILFLYWLHKYIVHRPSIIIQSTAGRIYFTLFFMPVKLLVIEHSLKQPELDRWSKFILSSFLTKKKQILTVSSYALTCIHNNFKIPIKKRQFCQYIYNCHPPIKKIENQQINNKITILTLGHVDHYKNPLFWFELAKNISDKHKNKVQFIWAGRGILLEHYISSAQQYENIHFIGHSKDVDFLYCLCDIYLQPSLQESHGISVIGAMAHGIPCVVSDIGGLPESVDDGQTGFVYQSNNLNEAIEKLDYLILNKPLRETFGKKGLDKYNSMFTMNEWLRSMNYYLKSVYNV